MWDDRPRHNARLHDEDAISILAVSALTALFEAGLLVEMELLRKRVLSRTSAQLFDQVRGADGQWHLAYKPMVELLLHHARGCATSGAPSEERREEIIWALEAAGF
jgi:hypothetical protein